MNLTVHESRGVFFVYGEFDASAADDFDDSMASALDGTGEVVLDLADLAFIDSTGVRTLALPVPARRWRPRAPVPAGRRRSRARTAPDRRDAGRPPRPRLICFVRPDAGASVRPWRPSAASAAMSAWSPGSWDRTTRSSWTFPTGSPGMRHGWHARPASPWWRATSARSSYGAGSPGSGGART